MTKTIFTLCITLVICLATWSANAATSIPFTISTSETVNVTGTPRIAVDVGGVTRYATYTSGTGTSSLTFTYTMVAGDVDLDGVTLTSPMQLNGGTIKDLNGNDATLTFTVPNTANVKVNYPSLGMDFVADADGRYTLNGTVYNDLASFLGATGGTFTRASVGTYYDSTGTMQTAASGVPRFDWDPVTHAAKGILIEESRTNLLLRSSEFENGVWGNSNISVTANTNETLAPDGTYSADKPVASTTATALSAQSAVITGTAAIFSVFVKQGSGATQANSFCLRNNTTATNLVCGNLNYATGVFTYSAGSTGVTTQLLSNGWMRLIMSATSGITSGDTIRVYSGYMGGGTTAGFFYYAWGAQLEAGAFPTSYIPTTAATVTRAADIFTVPTGAWFNSSSGAIVSSFSSGINSGIKLVYRIGGGAGSIGPYAINNNINVDKNSTGALFIHTGGYSGSAIYGLKYDAGGISGSLNGGSVSTSPQIGQASPSSIYIGKESAPTNMLNGQISKLKYYPSAVTDTQLQLMTQ